MVREDHQPIAVAAGTDQRASTAAPPPAWAFRLAAVAVAALGVSGSGFLMLHWLGGGANPPAAGAPPARLFRLWPQDKKPDAVLVLSGQNFGFIQPCGCSRPQYGGLERRYNFLQTLIKERGWPVMLVDLGDIAQRSGPQALLKYRFFMEALKGMNYTAVGIGRNELALSLPDVLGEFALNNPLPRVLAANLRNRDKDFPGMMKGWEIAKAGAKLKVAVVGVVDTDTAREVQDPAISFEAAEKVLPGVLKEIAAEKPDLRVLLFQGSEAHARDCAQKFPQFRVVLCLSAEEEPPAKPDQVGNTLVLSVGHKGRSLGAVGVFNTGQADHPLDLHYERVDLGEEYETPAGKDAVNPTLGLLEDYTKAVKAGNYLARYVQYKTKHPIQVEAAYAEAKYVGSEKCKKCHEKAFKIWQESPHSHAYDTLTKATRPSLRQYDGECVLCHVTGFQYETGYRDETSSAKLKDNGCENCHGPGSLHVKDNHDMKLLALMNPYKATEAETKEPKNDDEKRNQEARRKQRLLRIDKSCQACHDTDNDVNWDFEKKWPKIIHMEDAP
jgi:hypothetical protein